MEPEWSYWDLVDTVWDAINIYEGATVFLESYDRADPAARLLFASHFCQSEVRNGGFWQFFGNSTGVLAPEAADGFREIGQTQVASLVRQAMATFGPTYVRDRTERGGVLNSLPRDCFAFLDRQFFSLIRSEAGGFEAAADNYAAGFNR